MRHLIRSTRDLPGEVWSDVNGRYGEYAVSNLGRVKSLRRKVNTWNGHKTIPEIICKQGFRNGYLRCKLGTVHRLVAIAFLGNPGDGQQVNHKNGVKTDNRAINLEWCSPAQNVRHAWDTGLCNDSTREKMSVKAKLRTGVLNSCWKGFVDIYDLTGRFVHQAESLKDAENWVISHTHYVKASKSNISLVCSGRRKNIYGHVFKFNMEANKND